MSLGMAVASARPYPYADHLHLTPDIQPQSDPYDCDCNTVTACTAHPAVERSDVGAKMLLLDSSSSELSDGGALIHLSRSRLYVYAHTHTHTHTHTFNGPLSGITQVNRYLKGKTNADFSEARDSEWQWHQLGHMQVCTSLQTDNHASTPLLGSPRKGPLNGCVCVMCILCPAEPARHYRYWKVYRLSTTDKTAFV